jgi:hypothetical protein
MVMSVGFDNLKYFGQFLCPAICDRVHHQLIPSLVVPGRVLAELCGSQL